MSSSQSSSQATGFEAYIAALANRTPPISPRQLHPDFETWSAFFDHVNSTGPLEITLPVSTKTNLELMRLLDVLRKENLDMVNVGDRPGHVAICTRAQATDLRAKAAPRMGMVRNYLTKPVQTKGAR
jgi:hypothetical protein